MVMVTWIGEGENGPQSNQWGRFNFEKGESVDLHEVHDAQMIEKARGNPFYEVAGPVRRGPGRPSNAALAERAKAAKAEADKLALAIELHGGPAPDATGPVALERKVAAEKAVDDAVEADVKAKAKEDRKAAAAEEAEVERKAAAVVEKAETDRKAAAEKAKVDREVAAEKAETDRRKAEAEGAVPVEEPAPPVVVAPPVVEPVVPPPVAVEPVPAPNPGPGPIPAPISTPAPEPATPAAPEPSQRVDVLDVPRSSVTPST